MNPQGLDLRRLSPSLQVSGQIQRADVATLAAAGIHTLICNRPDGEAPDQPGYREIEAEAHRHGLRCVWLPVVGGHIDAAHARAFGAVLAASSGPVLAYCRSGMRCTVLWAFSQAARRPWHELQMIAAEAGYDLTGLSPPSETLRG